MHDQNSQREPAGEPPRKPRPSAVPDDGNGPRTPAENPPSQEPPGFFHATSDEFSGDLAANQAALPGTRTSEAPLGSDELLDRVSEASVGDTSFENPPLPDLTSGHDWPGAIARAEHAWNERAPTAETALPEAQIAETDAAQEIDDAGGTRDAAADAADAALASLGWDAAGPGDAQSDGIESADIENAEPPEASPSPASPTSVESPPAAASEAWSESQPFAPSWSMADAAASASFAVSAGATFATGSPHIDLSAQVAHAAAHAAAERALVAAQAADKRIAALEQEFRNYAEAMRMELLIAAAQWRAASRHR